MKESEKKLSNCSNKVVYKPEPTSGDPLIKQDILDIYSDVFTRKGKFPGMPYKFQLKQNAKPTQHAPRKVPIHLQDAFHQEIREFGETRCHKMGQQLCNCGEEGSSQFLQDSNQLQQSGHSMNKKLRICLDPRDLNEALEREPYYTWSIE